MKKENEVEQGLTEIVPKFKPVVFSELSDKEKIIVRAGHHCAEPYMTELGVPATIRVSLAFYNTFEECDKLVEVLKKAGDYIDVLF